MRKLGELLAESLDFGARKLDFNRCFKSLLIALVGSSLGLGIFVVPAQALDPDELNNTNNSQTTDQPVTSSDKNSDDDFNDDDLKPLIKTNADQSKDTSNDVAKGSGQDSKKTDEKASDDAGAANSPKLISKPVMQAKKKKPKPEKFKKDWWIGQRLVDDVWLDRIVISDPGMVADLCNRPATAVKLAKHRHLGEIAKANHNTCRYITQWRDAARALVMNRECDIVITYDPEGIYRAIKRDPFLARMLVKHPMINEMIDDNPELGRVIARHMR
jgi:hypothetical protein